MLTEQEKQAIHDVERFIEELRKRGIYPSSAPNSEQKEFELKMLNQILDLSNRVYRLETEFARITLNRQMIVGN